MAGSVVTDARPARAHDHTTRTGAGGWLVPLPAWLPGAASPALLGHAQRRAAPTPRSQRKEPPTSKAAGGAGARNHDDRIILHDHKS